VFTYNAKHKDGLQSQGGYSSHIISGEHYTFKVPDNLDLAGVAPLLCAGECREWVGQGWRGCSVR
jgi:D-arabinose 1-dehydrogenase-like Zn-dependent alcohol dehydrogenase